MNSFRTYWDLSDDERGALTQEQVRDYCKLELMTKGVEPVVETPDLPVEIPPVESRTYWCVKWTVEGRYGRTEFTGEVAFDTAEEAEAFSKLKAYHCETNYELPDRIIVARPLHSPICEGKVAATSTSVSTHMGELKRAKANLDANQAQRQKLSKQLEAANSATKGLWEDWHQQQSRIAHAQHVRRVHGEYLKMTNGDAAIARTFLEKTFTAEVVDAALGAKIPTLTLVDDAGFK